MGAGCSSRTSRRSCHGKTPSRPRPPSREAAFTVLLINEGGRVVRGIDPSSASNPVNCYTPKGGSKTCVGPAVIFENEDAQIQPSAFTSTQAGFVTKNPTWGLSGKATTSQIKKDAIFFFSAGKYAVQCKPKAGADCGGSPLGTGNKNALGEINGVAATEANILTGTFSDDRYLYNVYSDGSNSNIPPADAATVNYVSEIGFICNPNKGNSAAAVDSLTGSTYINEIQSIILAAGFYPLSAGAPSGTVNQTEIDEGPVTNAGNPGSNPASDLLNGTNTQGSSGTTGLYGYARYKQYDGFASSLTTGDALGFCLVTTTDGNANS